MKERLLRSLGLASAAGAGLYAYASYAARRFEDLDHDSAGAPGAFVDVDGVPIHYVEAGQGDSVLLIHGLGASTFSFRHIIPELAQHYRVVALDLKGFGYSGRPANSDYSLTAQADLVRGVMDRLRIEQAAVVGHSMGGAVAMWLALRHPALVSRLMLVNSATDFEMHRATNVTSLLRPFFVIGALFAFHRRSYRRRAFQTMVHDPAHVTPEVLEGYFRPSRMKGHLRALASLSADRRRDPPLDLERIRQPALVLWGEHDRWLPPARGEELARRIPNARFELVRGAAHMPLEEQPESCNAVLLAFLGAADPAADVASREVKQAH